MIVWFAFAAGKTEEVVLVRNPSYSVAPSSIPPPIQLQKVRHRSTWHQLFFIFREEEEVSLYLVMSNWKSPQQQM